MAKVEIVESLLNEIEQRFKGESHKILDLLEILENNPKKGKAIGNVGGVVIKELRYKSFRFYFISDGYKIRCFDSEHLTDLLIRFVRMSDKKEQQEVIDEIKKILREVGPSGFD